jgi:hypothetical protein
MGRPRAALRHGGATTGAAREPTAILRPRVSGFTPAGPFFLTSGGRGGVPFRRPRPRPGISSIHMSRSISIMTTRLVPAALALGLVLSAAAMPGRAAVCNNVVFQFTNTTSGPLLLQKVGYRDLDSGDPNKRWIEDFKDVKCPAGDTCSTAPQDLGSITRPRENHELTDIQVLHSHEDEFGDWMTAVWSSKNVPANMTCTDGRTYGPYDVN